MRRAVWKGLWLAGLLGAGCGSTWELEDLDGDSFTWLAGDCDDDNPAIHPAAEELCDGLDNDCDGLVDPADATGALEWYGDKDGDGYSGDEVIVLSCDPLDGYALTWDDCDDSSGGINPDALEYCDGLDNNCDGVIDEPAALDARIWYLDSDGDGFAPTDAESQRACAAPDGYVESRGDCNDDDPAVNPDAIEVDKDGVDNDCDGEGS